MNICAYCGRESPVDATQCSGCGTSFGSETVASESEPAKRSKAVAVTLALIFGPLGLLYLGLEGLLVVLAVLGAAFFAAPFILGAVAHIGGFGLLISLLGRVASAWWALSVVDRRNTAPEVAEARVLLDEAAKLENVDLAHAVAKYEEVIEKYPTSSACALAKTCVQTIKSHQGSGKSC